MHKPIVVIPNLNGGEVLVNAVRSLKNQTVEPYIMVVDNASTDNSMDLVKKQFPDVEVVVNSKNLGYTGGVNPGMQRAIDIGAPYVAPFNNDATADKFWLQQLVAFLDAHLEVGAVAPKVLNEDGSKLDSTGDYYTVWGLPYPRGRGETDTAKYDHNTDIFAASGAASLYRVQALQEVGLLDQDFFAYYEDVDLSFRLQLAGWKVAYEPKAVVYHSIGMTSSRMKSFTTYQTMKNLPLILYKNVPAKYLFPIGWRFMIAHVLFFLRAISRGQGFAALRGDAKATCLLLAKVGERRHIQKSRKIGDKQLWGMLVHDLPPNAHALRKLRTSWAHLTRKVSG